MPPDAFEDMRRFLTLGMLATLLANTACAHFRIAPRDLPPATQEQERRVHVIGWGALESRIEPVNCHGAGLAQVTMTVSALDALAATAAAFFSPTRAFAAHGRSGDGGFVWTNKHLNLSARVSRYYDVWNRGAGAAPTGLPRWRAGFDQLRSILHEAEYKAWRVRAVGSRWSLSPVAVSPDVMINTAPLNCLQVGLPEEHVSSTHADPAHLVWAQCGTTVMELSASLESRGLSLPTSGASNGQTIAGAIATGTHGSALRVGSMQDYILGLHLMVDDGRHYWIERASRPIVSDAFCAELGAQLVRDDGLFNAALVSFGSFGIVHAVLFEAVPLYSLEVHRQPCDWQRVATAACRLDFDALDLPLAREEPFHFDVMLNPYCLRGGHSCSVLTMMYKRAYRAAPSPPRGDVRLVPGADLLGLAGALAGLAPKSIPRTVERLFQGMLKAARRPPFGTHGQVFGPTELVGRSLSMELGCALPDAPAALETLVDTARSYGYPGVIGLRFVRKSNALLAFTRFDTTCTIEMSGAGGPRTAEFYERAWSALEVRRIPFTQHWGKINNTSQSNILGRWGEGASAWIEARRSFLSPTAQRMFSNEMLANAGLE